MTTKEKHKLALLVETEDNKNSGFKKCVKIQDFEDVLSKKFSISSELTSRGYIFPNGKNLALNSYVSHAQVLHWLIDNGCVEEYDGIYDGGCPPIEDLGCIRTNLDSEGFVMLSIKEPTTKQYEVLLDFFDKYLSRSGQWRYGQELMILTPHQKSDFAKISLTNKVSDDIIDIIKNYYRTGKIVETLNIDKLNTIEALFLLDRDNDIDLKEELIETSKFDVYVYESPYQVKQRLISSDESLRVFIDEEHSLYLSCFMYEATHSDMVDVAKDNGYDVSMDDFNPKKVCIIFVPVGLHEYSDMNDEDAKSDDYDTVYEYDNFKVYSRYQDFSKFQLSNILGKYKKRRIKNIYESKEDKEKFAQWAKDSELVNMFWKNQKRLKDKDIYTWMKKSPDELRKEIEKLSKTDGEIKSSGYDKLAENEEYTLFKIKTYEGAVKLGKGTQWCIASINEPILVSVSNEVEYNPQSDDNCDNIDDYNEEWLDDVSQDVFDRYGEWFSEDGGIYDIADEVVTLSVKPSFYFESMYGECEIYCVISKTDKTSSNSKIAKVVYADGDVQYFDANDVMFDDDTTNNVPKSALELFRTINESLKEEKIEIEKDSQGNELTAQQSGFFKNSKVRDEKNRLLVVYHGTSKQFDDETFKSSINWFTTGPAYAKGFGTWTGKQGYNYSCYLNCVNVFDCGLTDEPIFGLIPIKPYKFSSRFETIFNKLNTNEKLIRNMIEEVANEFDEKENGYKMKIHVLTRSKQFRDLLVSQGYDCMKCVENSNVVTFGVFNANQIKSIDNKNPTDSKNINESKADEQKLIDFAGDSLAKRFLSIKSRLKSPENDIYYWLKKDIVELEDRVNEVESTMSKTKQKEIEKTEGAELVAEENGWKVYRIDSYEASCLYGKGTKWCTASKETSSHFNNYKEKGIKLYYFIKDNEKYALALYPEIMDAFNIYGIKTNYEIYDATDELIIDFNQIKSLNLPEIPGIKLTFELLPAKIKGDVLVKVYPYNQGEFVIPNSVTKIGSGAFYNCRSLTSITIPNSVNEIGNSAFTYCTSLKSITIPNSVTEIGDFAFYDCSSLTSITIPNSVTSIGNSAFSNCESLTSITIPNSVTEIGDFAFYNCTSLTSIIIPNSVNEIGDYAFYDCKSLKSITLSNSVTKIGGSAFSNCKYLKSITIPNSVTEIGDRAFYNCKSLTSITIPNSVTKIGDRAFYNCPSLTIYAEATSKSTGWDMRWNLENRPVVWNYKNSTSSNNINEYLNEDIDDKLQRWQLGGENFEDIFDAEDIKHFDSNIQVTDRPLYRCQKDIQHLKVGDIIDFDRYRSFSNSEQGFYDVMFMADDSYEDFICLKTQGEVSYFDTKNKYTLDIHSDDYEFGSSLDTQEEVFVKGKFKVVKEEEVYDEYIEDYHRLFVIEQVKESIQESKQDQQNFIDKFGQERYDRFMSLKNRLENKDIYYWLKRDESELDAELDKIENKKTNKEVRNDAKSGATLIYEDENWKVYRIDSYEASKYYGYGTQWCISSAEPVSVVFSTYATSEEDAISFAYDNYEVVEIQDVYETDENHYDVELLVTPRYYYDNYSATSNIYFFISTKDNEECFGSEQWNKIAYLPEADIFWDSEDLDYSVRRDFDKLPQSVQDIFTNNRRLFESLTESKQDREKFAQWAGKELADRYFKVRDRLKEKYKDITWIMKNMTRDDLERDYIEPLEKTPTRSKIDNKGKEGAELVYENGAWKVYKINNYEASIKYGKGTKWCITGSNTWAGEDRCAGRDDFDRHTETNSLYFYLSKKDKRKYALEFNDVNDWALFNEEDYLEVGKGVTFKDALNYMGGDYWNPFDTTRYPALPHVKGLPDIQKAYRDVIADIGEDELDANDYIAESLSDKEKEVIDTLDKYFGQKEPYVWSTYILPNGHFLNPENYKKDDAEWQNSLSYEHEDFYFVLDKFGVAEDRVFEDYCIKVNVTYPYVAMPNNRATSEQFLALRKLIDRRDEFEYSFDEISDRVENGSDVYDMTAPLIIILKNSEIVVDIDSTDVSSIVKMISRAYTTGTLLAESALNEVVETNSFTPYTAGYILEDGSLLVMDEYHGEEEIREFYPEYSNTHPEEDTCVRLYSRPNEAQYKRLEEIIDYYLNHENYCKVEIWNKPGGKYSFYEVYSLYEGACEDSVWDEKIGNWTGYKLVQTIKNYFAKRVIEGIIKKSAKYYTPGEKLEEKLGKEQLPKYLYHATYKPFLNSIKEKGLGNTRKKMWSDSTSGVVYLATDENVAYSYAETAEWLDDVEDYDKYADNIVILKIDTDKLDKTKFKKDSNVIDGDDTFEYHGVISFEFVEDILDKTHIGESLSDYEENIDSSTYYRLELINPWNQNMGGIFSSVWSMINHSDNDEDNDDELEDIIDDLMSRHDVPPKWLGEDVKFAFKEKFIKDKINSELIKDLEFVLNNYGYKLLIDKIQVKDADMVWQDENQIAFVMK